MKLNNFGKRYECYTDIVRKGIQKEDNHKNKNVCSFICLLEHSH